METPSEVILSFLLFVIENNKTLLVVRSVWNMGRWQEGSEDEAACQKLWVCFNERAKMCRLSGLQKCLTRERLFSTNEEELILPLLFSPCFTFASSVLLFFPPLQLFIIFINLAASSSSPPITPPFTSRCLVSFFTLSSRVDFLVLREGAPEPPWAPAVLLAASHVLRAGSGSGVAALCPQRALAGALPAHTAGWPPTSGVSAVVLCVFVFLYLEEMFWDCKLAYQYSLYHICAVYNWYTGISSFCVNYLSPLFQNLLWRRGFYSRWRESKYAPHHGCRSVCVISIDIVYKDGRHLPTSSHYIEMKPKFPESERCHLTQLDPQSYIY